MDMSGHRSSRRYAIVAETRRRWSHEEKLAIVSQASGVSVNVSAVARRHGIRPSLLFRWKKELGTLPEAPAASVAAALVPVTVSAPTITRSKDIAAADGEPMSRLVEIVLANGRCLRVWPGIDGAALERLLRVVDR